MYRSVTYSSADKYCRYLDISLSHSYWSGVCGGRFGYYLKDNFAIEKLPYDIKLSELILNGALSPELLVKLPASYLKKWSNFPEHPAAWTGVKNAAEKAAGNYDIHLFSPKSLALTDLLHPYDCTPLKIDFADKFRTEIPKKFKIVKIPERQGYIPFEAYFAYWHGYVLADALSGYLDIERFLPPKQGIAEIVARVSSVNEEWNRTYSNTFRRVSMYRTAMSIVHSGHSKTDLTFADIGNFLLDKSASNIDMLENDLKNLLILFAKWQDQIDQNGRWNLRKPLDLLRQDIYHLFQWLCITSRLGEMHYFDKWSYKHFRTDEWAELKEVLEYEEFDLQKTFIRFMKFYCEEIKEFGYADNLNDIYIRLCEINSFGPWIRSFCEIHKNINRKGIIRFEQPRILDYLIVMTIRTEIVIREKYCKLLSKEDPYDLVKVFVGLSTVFKDHKTVKVLESLHTDWPVTKLNDKPEDIFSKIDSIKPKSSWSKEMMYFYRQILKFVTSRNYFAHHSYKDDEINMIRGTISTDVLKSCIQSLMFIDGLQ
jgi:hypothetical protein